MTLAYGSSKGIDPRALLWGFRSDGAAGATDTLDRFLRTKSLFDQRSISRLCRNA